MRKFILVRHIYAPEMNYIKFNNGVEMKAPQCSTIADVKNRYFKPRKSGLFCVIQSTYTAKKWQHLNKRVAGGKVETRLKALQFSKQFYQKGGVLIDGTTLPPNTVKLTFHYFQ